MNTSRTEVYPPDSQLPKASSMHSAKAAGQPLSAAAHNTYQRRWQAAWIGATGLPFYLGVGGARCLPCLHGQCWRAPETAGSGEQGQGGGQ